MSRGFTIGGTDLIRFASSPITNYPFTLACWLKVAVVQPGANQNAMNWYFTGNQNSNNIGIAVDNTSGKAQCFVSDNGGTFDTSGEPGAILSANTWYPIVYVGTSSTSRTTYIMQGGTLNTGSQTASIVFGGNTNSGTVGTYTGNATTDFGGSVAEEAFWSAALSTLEVTAYCLGQRAWFIRGKSLVGYWPFDGKASPEPDLSGSKINGTVTNTTSTFGPPIGLFTPKWPQFPLPLPPPPPPQSAGVIRIGAAILPQRRAYMSPP